MRKNKIRIGMIGLDHWYSAEFVAKSIMENNQTDLVTVWHRDLQKVKDIIPVDNIELTNDWRSIIQRNDIDAVVSFVPVEENVDVVIPAAKAGKHILSVKPVAMNVEDIDTIISVVKETGIVFFPMEGFYRLSPHCLKMNELLGEKRIGTVLRICVVGRHALPKSWPGEDACGWFSDPKKVPGGAWLDHAVYQIALIRWFLGAEATSVCGETKNLLSGDMIANEDYGLAEIRFSDNTIVTIEATWTMPSDLNYYQIDVIGSEGMISYSSRDLKLWIFENEGWTEQVYDDKQADPVQHFVDILKGTVKPICCLGDARADLLCCLSFYEAAELGTKVIIE